MFKVGDKVRTGRGLQSVRGCSMVQSMREYEGQIFTVTGIGKDETFYLDNGWVWHVSWLIPISSQMELTERIAELEARVAELEEAQRDPEEMVPARLLYDDGRSREIIVNYRAKKTGLKNVRVATEFIADESGDVDFGAFKVQSFRFDGQDGNTLRFKEVKDVF